MASEALPDFVREGLQDRAEASRAFFEAEAPRLARLCHAMAERFAVGGRLIACGLSPAARSDVRHVAVEFVHPVIVGKRALPALGLTGEGGPLSSQLDLIARPADIVMGFQDKDLADDALAATLALARSRGCLTIAFSPAGAEWEMRPPAADPFVRQELVETLYHLLWELVHVFFEHPGLLGGERERRTTDAGASGFLYPFLKEEERDLEAVLEDVRRSALMKANEVTELRQRTVEGSLEPLLKAARGLRRALEAGGTVLALGNGGSATDATDAVADLRAPPGGWPARPALDLTEDPSILTALANDIGTDALFSRQVIAYARPGDALLAFSTSGGSRNVIQALEEARRREIFSVALVGYDGGRIAEEGLADAIIISPSQNIPRIQEAQATAWHLLRDLLERVE